MENVHTKTVQSTRRTKYVMIGLTVVILILSFNMYKTYYVKKELVRRTNFLILRLRAYKEEQDKLSDGIKEKSRIIKHQQQLLAQKEEDLRASNNQVETLANANQRSRNELAELKQSASSSRESLLSLKKEHEGVSSQLTSVKESFKRALLTCNSSTHETQSLKQNYFQKEADLKRCLERSQEQQNQLQAAYSKLGELARQRKTDNTVVSPELNTRSKIPQANPASSNRAVDTVGNTGPVIFASGKTGDVFSPQGTPGRSPAAGGSPAGTLAGRPQSSTGTATTHPLSRLGNMLNQGGPVGEVARTSSTEEPESVEVDNDESSVEPTSAVIRQPDRQPVDEDAKQNVSVVGADNEREDRPVNTTGANESAAAGPNQPFSHEEIAGRAGTRYRNQATERREESDKAGVTEEEHEVKGTDENEESDFDDEI